MLVRGTGHILALAALIALLSGCAQRDAQPASVVPISSVAALAGRIPVAHQGDVVAYETDNYRAIFQVDAFAAAPAIVHRSYSALGKPPTWPAYRDAIDPRSNRLAYSIDPCPFADDHSCHGPYGPDYEALRFEGKGLPWGYGSSIFQGRLLREGTTFDETFPLGLVPVTVHYEVLRAWNEGNATHFTVHGSSPLSTAATEMIDGSWEVSDASPYVLSYHTNLSLAYAADTIYAYPVNASLSEYTPGIGDPIVDASPRWSLPDTRGTDASPLQDGLPIGSDAELGFEGYTFRGAWSHLRSQDPALASAARQPGFRMWHMQVPREENDDDRIVLRDHYVEGSFAYFSGATYASAFVAHECLRGTLVRFELTCDYAGTGPVDAPAAMRGNVSFTRSIDLRRAYDIANATLPGVPVAFAFSTYTNGVEDPAFRQEAYAFTFYFQPLDGDGQTVPDGPRGFVRVDALTGEILSRTVDASIG